MKTLLSFTFHFFLILWSEVLGKISPSNSKHVRALDEQGKTRKSEPWAIYIQQKGEINNLCSGSLLSKEWILTAVRCLHTESDFQFFQAVAEYEGKRQIRNVDRFIIHPKYDEKRAITEDIALLHVSQPFDTNKFVQPIALPAKDNSFTGNAKLFGFSEGIRSSIFDPLQVVTLKILDHDACNKMDGGIIEDYILCAVPETGSESSCKGGAGGGFEQNGKLVGVLSTTLSCQFLFIKVNLYLDWIRSNMGIK